MAYLRILSLLIFCWLPSTALATEKMPPTFLVKREGNWMLWDNYLNGNFIIVDNEDAKTKVVLPIKDLLPEEEYDKYFTTAGARWGVEALNYFTQLNGRDVFRVRTRYGTDVLIDLDAAKQMPAKVWRNELKKQDALRIEKILQDAVADRKLKEPAIDYRMIDAALVHAMHYEMKSLLGLIQRLEDYKCYSSSIGPSLSDPFTQQEGPNENNRRWWYDYHSTRRLASLAIRRLGGVPKGYRALSFVPKDEEQPVDLKKREQAIASVTAGIAPKAVYQLLGAPDYIPFGYWRYDIDAAEPYTLRVVWDEQGLVKEVEKVSPPSWQGDLAKCLNPRDN